MINIVVVKQLLLNPLGFQDVERREQFEQLSSGCTKGISLIQRFIWVANSKFLTCSKPRQGEKLSRLVNVHFINDLIILERRHFLVQV